MRTKQFFPSYVAIAAFAVAAVVVGQAAQATQSAGENLHSTSRFASFSFDFAGGGGMFALTALEDWQTKKVVARSVTSEDGAGVALAPAVRLELDGPSNMKELSERTSEVDVECAVAFTEINFYQGEGPGHRLIARAYSPLNCAGLGDAKFKKDKLNWSL